MICKWEHVKLWDCCRVFRMFCVTLMYHYMNEVVIRLVCEETLINKIVFYILPYPTVKEIALTVLNNSYGVLWELDRRGVK